MHQFIAPKALIVNGKPSPCECREGVVCVYCVQANLIVWEKKGHPGQDVKNRVLKGMKKMGPRKVGRLLGVDHKTVSRWIKTGNISGRHLENADKALGMAI